MSGRGARRGGGCPAAWLALLVVVLVAPAAPVARAADAVGRYSGRVERVDLVEGVVVVSELGARGRAELRAVHVGEDTPIISARRLPAWQMRGVGAYGEVPVSLADLVVGDFVVVEVAESDGRAEAVRITIVEGGGRH